MNLDDDLTEDALTEEDIDSDEGGDIGDSSIQNDCRLGHLEIIELFGGTRSFIALAYDSERNREVVIREIQSRDHFTGEEREKCSRLANALAQIKHPNVRYLIWCARGRRPLLFDDGSCRGAEPRGGDLAGGCDSWQQGAKMGLRNRIRTAFDSSSRLDSSRPQAIERFD